MKKTLIFTADRGRVLTLRDLIKIATDAENISISSYTAPVVELVPTTTRSRTRGEIRKITVERSF